MRCIALAGNPNVGKSTLFNRLTGMKQHTGNWPGKTVELAQGEYTYKGKSYQLIDLPGTYSLASRSKEEAVSEEFIRKGEVDCMVVVCDATCLARTMYLCLQIMELSPRVVLCINLVDEARRNGKEIYPEVIEQELGVPVILTCGDTGEGIEALLEAVRNSCEGFVPQHLPLGCGIYADTEEETGEITRKLVHRAEMVAEKGVRCLHPTGKTFTQKLDRIVLNRWLAGPIMLLLLLGVFWLTIYGANYPSAGLQWCFDKAGEWLRRGAEAIALPSVLCDALFDGVYGTVARVISVMLPPMAIFFPLFTILEDFGYLPRVAFLMDHRFHRAGACGKQALTMCMGFGCNAAGVVGCRIIDSPRERLIAMLTNSFVPCNGRFPGLIFLISLSFSGKSTILGAGLLTLCVLLAVGMTLAASNLLYRTGLKGEPSSFVLELPAYRRPHIGQVILRSVKDRTVTVLGRAVAVAAPAGLAIWLLANVQVDGNSLLSWFAGFLDSPARYLGLNGAILLAFLLGSPANELVLPILIMILTQGGALGGDSTGAMAEVLNSYGWTWELSLCTLVFFLFHWPCTTTVLTIYKETRSVKWTGCSVLLPTAFGAVLCLLISLVLHLLG